MTCRSVKKRTRPKIEASIHQCAHSFWRLFRNYHYLNTELNKAAKCFVAVYNNRPVGFIALLHSPYKEKYWRVSRLVVLPDYQGVGIGTRFLTVIAEHWTAKTGVPLFITTSNPQLRNINRKSRWRLTRIGHTSGKWKRRKDLYQTLSKRRLTFSFKYVPERRRRPILLKK
jgi:GNAT superfamily N-acetyltransferase